MRRKLLIAGAVVAGVVLLGPVGAWAATATFVTGGSATTLNVSQTGTGRAVNALSNGSHTGVFVYNGTSGNFDAVYGVTKSATTGSAGVFGYANNNAATTTVYGVYGQSNSKNGQGVYGYVGNNSNGVTDGVHGRSMASGNNASGVFGENLASTGLTNGVYGLAGSTDGAGVFGKATGSSGLGLFGIASGTQGIGGFGLATSDSGVGLAGTGGGVGVLGDSLAIGDGSFGLMSMSDVGFVGHVLSGTSNVSGRCTVLANATTGACTYSSPFPTGSTPDVTITPNSNPGGFFWITGQNLAGFTINLSVAPSANVEFTWIALGRNPGLFPVPASNRARSQSAARR